jgi:hypothetical protein
MRFNAARKIVKNWDLSHQTSLELPRMSLALCALVGGGLFLLVHGCSAGPAQSNPQKVDAAAALVASRAQENNDLERLTRLWERRKQERLARDYTLGPGDVIEVNVAGVDEIKYLSERVTAEGTITLPFVGVINTQGLTDKTLRAEISRRLETNYVRNPQISLFVKEFRSRQVAVIGAVHKPGLYNLASPAG